MSIEIREESISDIASVFQLNCEVFKTQAEAKLINSLRTGKNLFLSMVATLNGEVVGHIALSPMQTESDPARRLIGLGPMAVSIRYQRKGIGSSLIKASEKRLIQMGTDGIFVLGHKEYYPKFGFKPSFSSFGVRSKYEVPDEYFMAKPLSKLGLSGLQGIVSYASEFDQLEA